MDLLPNKAVGSRSRLKSLAALLLVDLGLAIEWEPSASDYWLEGAHAFLEEIETGVARSGEELNCLNLKNMGSSFPVLNFTPNLSAGIFDQLVREGRPFVVRNLVKSLPMKDWDCEFFRENKLLRRVKGRREYGDKNASQEEWKSLRDILDDQPKQENPSASPYYVGLKDVLHDPGDVAHDPLFSQTWSRQVLELVQEHTATPSFMSDANLGMLQSTPEFWFLQAGAGTHGAKAHVDSHSESTWSMQLCGTKRWRLSPIGQRNAPHVMKIYQDGQIYERAEQSSWNIFEEVLLHPGDALFFGPGFIHETLKHGTAPAASVTWQFDKPLPTTFLRKFLVRLRFTPDLFETWRQMERLMRRAKMSDWQTTQADLDLRDILDVNGDGKATLEEKTMVLNIWDLVIERVRSQVPKKLQRLKLGMGQIVHDEQDLLHMPSKIQSAVRSWEKKAFGLDEATATAHLHTEFKS